MPEFNYSKEVTLTAMIVWEYWLNQDENSVFHQFVENHDQEGVVSKRSFCLGLSLLIESAWDDLSMKQRDTFISSHCDNDLWDWEVVPSICLAIASNNITALSDKPKLLTLLK
jgi:hypothetical protein